MGIGDFLARFVFTFVIVLIVNAAVVWLWNLVRHGAGMFDWGTSLVFAVVFGIVFPLVYRFDHKARPPA